jgi:hypothetical protein
MSLDNHVVILTFIAQVDLALVGLDIDLRRWTMTQRKGPIVVDGVPFYDIDITV